MLSNPDLSGMWGRRADDGIQIEGVDAGLDGWGGIDYGEA